MKAHHLFFILAVIALSSQQSTGQPLSKRIDLTRQDSLRGSLNPERAWWDVKKYAITVTPDYTTKTIMGTNTITYFQQSGYIMQLDLQEPMMIDSIISGNNKFAFTREGNAYHVVIRDSTKKYRINPGPVQLTVFFHGTPKEAIEPPWDGGWIWSKDQNGNPWMSVACQGLGASAWYPCKDHQSDEPDSASLTVRVPDSLVAVGNGTLAGKFSQGDGTTSYTWQVKNPINNYNIVPYIGKYANFSEVFKGESGKLNVNYWVLDYNLAKAKEYMRPQVEKMLTCFEYWFGPYPFYKDGYKLVEAPHLGMEHQSAIAYGNGYKMGYMGKDWSKSGWGLKWDFLIIHESGHEWFGNNITAKDIADMWIHESFTNYSETLYTECQFGKQAGNDYVAGTREVIQNDIPIVGIYGVNKEGSGDMYWKGANMLHTIRQVINDDKKFRSILRGLNSAFYHKTVTGKEVEDYISKACGKDLSKIFDQYLRTIQVPVLEYKIDGYTLTYRWTNCVKGFNLPLKITFKGERWIKPTEQWSSISMYPEGSTAFKADNNFYIQTKQITNY